MAPRPLSRVVAAAAAIFIAVACADDFLVDPGTGFSATVQPASWPEALLLGEVVTLRVAVRDQTTGALVDPDSIEWSTVPAGALAPVSAEGDQAVFRVAALGTIEVRASLHDPAFDTASTTATLESRLSDIVVEAAHGDTLRSLGDTLVVRARGIDANGDRVQVDGWIWTVHGPAIASTGSLARDSISVVSVLNGSGWVVASHPHCAVECRDSVAVGVRQTAASISLDVDSVRLGALTATATVTATVLDARGAPIVDAMVTWESAASTVATVTPNPIDPTQATLTAAANGATIVRARTAALTDSLTALVVQEAVDLVAIAGGEQSTVVATTLPDSLTAEARDAAGFPVPGASVTWSVLAGGGTISADAVTGADGRARAAWTLGTTAGTHLASVTIAAGDTLRFEASGTPAAAASVVAAGAASLSSVGETTTLHATVTDEFGNPRADDVAWRSLAPSIATAGASTGVVTAVANGVAGIEASVAGIADTAVIAVQQVPVSIELSEDSVRFGAFGAATTLSVTVRDALDSPIAAPQGITWETTAATVVSVASDASDSTRATVTAEGNGTAHVRVRIDALSDETRVTVTQGVASAVIVAGAAQSDTVGSLLPDSLRVEARDELGSTVAGAVVSWSVLSGGGAVSGSGTTGADGRSAAAWTLGDVAGPQQVRAVVAGSDTLFFSATALPGAPASIEVTPTSVSLTSIQETVQLTAIVRDSLGNVLADPVNWLSLTPSIATVGAATGVVTAISNGSTTVEASVGGIADTVAVTVHQAPATLVLSEDSLRFGALGATATLSATVRDALGSPIAAPQGITWETTAAAVASVAADGSDSTRATVTSTGNGTAHVRVRLEGLSDETHVTVAQTLASAVIVGGAGQTDTVGSLLADSLRVEARDALGATVAGAAVAWTVTIGGGSVSGSSLTGAAGQAAVAWTLGGAAGPHQVRAVVAGSDTVFFDATALAGEPASIDVTPATASLNFIQDTVHLTATVRDAFGNPLAGAPTWSSSDAAVATVGSTGIVTATGNGSAFVVAEADLLADTSVITVAQVVASIDLSPTSDTLSRGDTLRLIATPRDSAGTTVVGAPIGWSSTDSLVASVDSTGKVTARVRGSATIRAVADGVLASADITVASWALAFAGDDLVEVASAPALDLDSIFTIEAWVRPRSTSGGALVAMWSGNKMGSSYALYLHGLVPRAYVRHGSGNGIDTISAAAPLEQDVWQHLAFVYDRGTVTLYVDGVAAVTAAGVALPNLAQAPLRFGADALATPSYLTGDLDEIRIWGTARTEAEILASMSIRLTTESGQRAYWPLFEGTGNPVDRIGGLIGVRGATLGAAAEPAWIMDGSSAP